MVENEVHGELDGGELLRMVLSLVSASSKRQFPRCILSQVTYSGDKCPPGLPHRRYNHRLPFLSEDIPSHANAKLSIPYIFPYLLFCHPAIPPLVLLSGLCPPRHPPASRAILVLFDVRVPRGRPFVLDSFFAVVNKSDSDHILGRDIEELWAAPLATERCGCRMDYHLSD